MQLYILRHADADTVAENDDERYLSEKGIVQSQRVARFCEAHQLAPSIVITSPIRRAHQTAKIVAEHLRVDLRVARWLSCGAAPPAVLHELNELRGNPSIMIVGHEPDLSQFISFFIGAAHAESIHIRKGSLTLLTVFAFEGGGARLEFALPAKLL